MKNNSLNITLLKGGWHKEREVSLNTGAAVAQALAQLGHKVHELDVQSEFFELPQPTDFVFICLHGTFGEDGQVQQILESKGVRYSGCGVIPSRKAMDKEWSKRLFSAAGVPTPKSAHWKPGLNWPLPYIIKPVSEGSSVGVFRIFEEREIEPAEKETAKLGLDMIVEDLIVGPELTVGILGERALPVIEIRPKSGFYDYTSKYTKGATEYLCPAPLSDDVTRIVQETALKAYQALDCEVYGRVDIMLNQANEPFVLEVNTIPGMTQTSLLPKAAAACGISFPDLCQQIIDLSWEVRPCRQLT